MSGSDTRPAELFQLDRATCLALLAVQHIGRLVVPGGDLRIVPVNYLLVDDKIVFRSEVGGRSKEIVDRTVSFEADMIDERTRSGWTVVVRGVGSMLTTRDGEAVLGDRTIRVESWAPGAKDRWLMITIGEVTGRLLRGEVTPPWVNERAYL
jgi:nitroimidazol reductase NimA-like FMN-containing flavoprotein (pyridoxamine 5'-phosphate oxidase superfamily)